MSEETGLILTRLRESRGETQEEVAAGIGSIQTVVSRHERTGKVSQRGLERYADHYGVSVDFLLGRVKDVPKPEVARETPPPYRPDMTEVMVAGLIEVLILGLEEYRRRNTERRTT